MNDVQPTPLHPPRLARLLLPCWLVLGVVGTAVSFAWGRGSPWMWVSWCLVLAALLVVGTVSGRSGLIAQPLVGVKTERYELALTFDGGPDDQVTLAVIDLLEARGHLGTFFVVGDRAEQQSMLLKRVAAGGHLLANHSLRDSPFTFLKSSRRLSRELHVTSEVIARARGGSPRFFRPPRGLFSRRVVRAAALAQLEPVAWTAAAGPSRTVARAVQRLTPHLRPGAIVVLRDGLPGAPGAPTVVAVLERLLELMEARGLRSVTLEGLLSASPVESREEAVNAGTVRRA